MAAVKPTSFESELLRAIDIAADMPAWMVRGYLAEVLEWATRRWAWEVEEVRRRAAYVASWDADSPWHQAMVAEEGRLASSAIPRSSASDAELDAAEDGARLRAWLQGE